MPKLSLAVQGGDPRTAYLRPIIEYLLAWGNRWPAGGGMYPRLTRAGGEGYHLFAGLIDVVPLRERFAFPASIQLYDDGSLEDRLNRGGD